MINFYPSVLYVYLKTSIYSKLSRNSATLQGDNRKVFSCERKSDTQRPRHPLAKALEFRALSLPNAVRAEHSHCRTRSVPNTVSAERGVIRRSASTPPGHPRICRHPDRSSWNLPAHPAVIGHRQVCRAPRGRLSSPSAIAVAGLVVSVQYLFAGHCRL